MDMLSGSATMTSGLASRDFRLLCGCVSSIMEKTHRMLGPSLRGTHVIISACFSLSNYKTKTRRLKYVDYFSLRLRLRLRLSLHRRPGSRRCTSSQIVSDWTGSPASQLCTQQIQGSAVYTGHCWPLDVQSTTAQNVTELTNRIM